MVPDIEDFYQLKQLRHIGSYKLHFLGMDKDKDEFYIGGFITCHQFVLSNGEFDHSARI